MTQFKGDEPNRQKRYLQCIFSAKYAYIKTFQFDLLTVMSLWSWAWVLVHKTLGKVLKKIIF